MTLASTSRTNLRFAVESAFGTIPATPSPEVLRMTGESLSFAISKTSSNEIRSDRQVSDLVATSASASGAVNFELSYKEYDDMIEAALQGSWLGCNDTAVAAATITLTNTITASAGTPFANIAAGQTVKFSGFTNAANNAPFVVATASPTVITVAGTPFTNEGPAAVNFSSYGKVTGSMTTTLGTTLTAAAGTPFANVVVGQWVSITGATITGGVAKVAQVVTKTSSTVLVFAAATFSNGTDAAAVFSGSRVANGTTQRSFSIEKEFADVAQFIAYRGMVASKLSLSLASGAIVTGSVDFLGKDSVRANATQLIGTPMASQTYDVMNAVTGVGNVMENGAVLTGTYIKTASVALDNKLRAQTGIGTLGNVGVGAGTLAVTGSLEVYLADGTLYDKFVNNTASSVSLFVQDGTAAAPGNGYILTFPKIKYSDAKVNAGGRDADAMIAMPFEAVRDPTTGYTMIVDRVGA